MFPALAVDPETIKAKPLGECRSGGLGVALMEQVMDEWSLCGLPCGCGNRLTMRKRIGDRGQVGEIRE